MMEAIIEAARKLPVIDEVDICVLGGSCTGVSAALRAARLGAKVAIVEQQNCFGGGATSGMVCIWHSLYDTEFKNQIIAGTTLEIIERLKRRKHGVVEKLCWTPPYRMSNIMTYYLNTEEMKIELDEMILEAGIKPYLHTFYAAPYVEDGQLTAVIVENKSGRGAIKAKVFVDATADGDLCLHLGAESYRSEGLQPATTGSRVYGLHKIDNPNATILQHKDEFHITDIGWDTFIPGTPEVRFWAKTNVYLNCSDGFELTKAEIEGRRQVRAMMDILRKYAEGGEDITLLALGSHIGMRETRQIKCQYQLTFQDVLYGKKFEDAVVNGAYPPDIHHHDKLGATYYYLDGVEQRSYHGMRDKEESRWREELPADPTYWQIPYRSMIVPGLNNVIVCGRAVDADKGAFAAIRVMVNMNQTGEAAGVAAYEALNSGKMVAEIDVQAVRSKLKQGGSVVL